MAATRTRATSPRWSWWRRWPTRVFASLGLDSGGSAVAYVTGWAEQAEADPVEAYAELIDRLARRLEAVVCDEG